MPPVIRLATYADAEGMAQYMNRLQAEGLDVITRRPPLSIDDEIEVLKKAEAHDRAFFLVAVDGQDVIGLLDCWGGDRDWNRHVMHLGMSVDRRFRRRGIGRDLVKHAINLARELDEICRLEVEVVAWNAPAVALYETTGFQHEGRKVKAVNLRGRPEDLLMMAMTW